MTVPKKKDHASPRPPRGEDFWRGATFEEVALLQGVRPVESLNKLLGGWPPEEKDDDFEETLKRWRQHDAVSSGQA